ncbi:MAG: FTR1 family protein [candidate division NC10 bacterium]|nr:FTR1 family protein [candidate division NC10 bacterium]
MLAGMLITIREGLEAFLITGVLLGYLKKSGQVTMNRYVWGGTITGVLFSIALALGFQALAIQFEGASAAIFEASASVLAILILSYMILWMQRQSRTLKTEIEAKAGLAISSGQIFALAMLAFVTVLREGLETAVFLTALTTRASAQNPLPGAMLGLVAAAAIAYLYFATTVKLNLRRFFIGTGFLLIFIAAGLSAHTFMALHELGFPPIIHKLWSTKWLIDSESLTGRLLHAFLGYHDEPTLMEAMAYWGYLGIMGTAFWRAIRETTGRPSTRAEARVVAGRGSR